MRGAISEGNSSNLGATTTTGFAISAVGIEGDFKISALAVDIDIEVIEARSALFDCSLHDLYYRGQDLLNISFGEIDRMSFRVNLRQPERLVGIDISNAADDSLVQKHAFYLTLAPTDSGNGLVSMKFGIKNIAARGLSIFCALPC